MPASPAAPDDRRLELVTGAALEELLVLDEALVVGTVEVDARDVDDSDTVDTVDTVGSVGTVEVEVRDVVVVLSAVDTAGGTVVVGVAVVLFTGIDESEVLAVVAALLAAVPLEPVSAGTVTGARVTPGTAAEVLRAAPFDVTVGDGADEVTALPQAASSRTVMPWPATIRALRRFRGGDTALP